MKPLRALAVGEICELVSSNNAALIGRPCRITSAPQTNAPYSMYGIEVPGHPNTFTARSTLRPLLRSAPRQEATWQAK